MINIENILAVLIRQVGDHRECPHCHKAFIPNDRTAKEALKAVKELEDGLRQA